MPHFAIVNQHNQRVRCISENGREYYSIRQYVPQTLDEARALSCDSAHGCTERGTLKLVEADEAPRAPWGCGVYQYNRWGHAPKLVRSDFDSSG
jgi:hypothetical protein